MARGALLCAGFVLGSANVVHADVPSFQSASGNILCFLNAGPALHANQNQEAQLSCLIFEADWVPPDAAEHCDLDETRILTLPLDGSATEGWTCHGDVFWPHPTPTIGSNATWSVAGFDCEIIRTGVTCRSEAGHGFRLARAQRSLY
ncbi:MAG: DUF6636 domain-containing protein [Pseudomonadota bacterium]